MSDGNMTYEDWLRGCVHHDGRHGYVTLPCDEVLKIADFIERLRADRKDEPQTCDDCIWSVCNYNKVFEDEPSKIIEAYSQGFKNGAEAVKAINDEQQMKGADDE